MSGKFRADLRDDPLGGPKNHKGNVHGFFKQKSSSVTELHQTYQKGQFDHAHYESEVKICKSQSP